MVRCGCHNREMTFDQWRVHLATYDRMTLEDRAVWQRGYGLQVEAQEHDILRYREAASD